MTKQTIIRVYHATEDNFDAITRVTGYLKGKHLLQLFQPKILDANPRKPKANRVASEIIDTLKGTPELFQFKSKGLLIGTASVVDLERNRYKVSFSKGSEGILDGGHNMLAIGIYLIEAATGLEWSRKIKTWEDLMGVWDEHIDDIRELEDEIDFYVTTELLIPADDSADTLEEFRIAMIDICAARNNNAQLSLEAKANQKGFYDEIRSRFENKAPELAKRIEWKLNEWESDDRTPIRVRDIVSLAWIPLSLLEQDDCLSDKEEFKLNPTLLYSSKAKLSENFDALMSLDDIASQQKNGKFELHNTAVGSAFDILTDLPELVDWMHVNLPKAYNRSGGKFGKIQAVKKPKRGTASTPFFKHPTEFKVPDGFVSPLVFGLGAIMQVKDCQVTWLVEPKPFLEKHFDKIVEGFNMAITMSNYDPQKVGKDKGSYNLAFQQYKFALMG